VILALLIRLPPWASTKVFALPIAFRLYVNRQGLAKGKKKTRCRKAAATKKRKGRRPRCTHRTRPELLVELLRLVAAWFPDRQIVVRVDSTYGGKSVLRQLPAYVDLISQVHPQGVLYAPPPAQQGVGRPPARRASACRTGEAGRRTATARGRS